MTESFYIPILVIAGLMTLSIVTSVVARRFGAPLLLLFLIIGLLAGVDGPGGLDFSNAPAAYFLGNVALAIILFDSGFGTHWRSYRLAGAPALTLATVGTLLTAALTAVPARYLLGLNWPEALLVGAIIASTDAAAVFFLLRGAGARVRERVGATLEIESGTNDPMAIFLVLTLLEFVASPIDLTTASLDLVREFLIQIGVGVVGGLSAGWLMVRVIGRAQFDPGLVPVILMSVALLLFAFINVVGGSGFLAVYLAGLVCGNVQLPHSGLVRRFQAGLTWVCQISMFLTLGLLATPSQFGTSALIAVIIGGFLIFLFRPAVVWLCLRPFRFSANETAFIGWVGLRGAVSILLAILPILYGVENGQLIFNVIFVIVLMSLVIQGWTVSPLARYLKLLVPGDAGPVDRVELELPGNARHELVAYRVASDSPVARGERIPRWARPSLIIREGTSLTAQTAGRLRAGDQVYIFTLPAQVKLLDSLFARPLKTDPGDMLFWGDFSLPPETPLLALAELYEIDLPDDIRDRTLGDHISSVYHGRVEVGDRVEVGPVDLIVRSLEEDGSVAEVGLALEHAESPRGFTRLLVEGPGILARSFAQAVRRS